MPMHTAVLVARLWRPRCGAQFEKCAIKIQAIKNFPLCCSACPVCWLKRCNFKRRNLRNNIRSGPGSPCFCILLVPFSARKNGGGDWSATLSRPRRCKKLPFWILITRSVPLLVNFFNAAGESCKIKIRQMGSFDRRLMNKLFVLRAQGEVGARQVLPRQIFHFGCLRGGSIAGAFQ